MLQFQTAQQNISVGTKSTAAQETLSPSQFPTEKAIMASSVSEHHHRRKCHRAKHPQSFSPLFFQLT